MDVISTSQMFRPSNRPWKSKKYYIKCSDVWDTYKKRISSWLVWHDRPKNSYSWIPFLIDCLHTYPSKHKRWWIPCEVWVTPQGKLEGCTVISRLFIMRNHTTNYLTLQSTDCRAALQTGSSPARWRCLCTYSTVRIHTCLAPVCQAANYLLPHLFSRVLRVRLNGSSPLLFLLLSCVHASLFFKNDFMLFFFSLVSHAGKRIFDSLIRQNIALFHWAELVVCVNLCMTIR